MVANKSPDGMKCNSTCGQWINHLVFRGLGFLMQALKCFYRLWHIDYSPSGIRTESIKCMLWGEALLYNWYVLVLNDFTITRVGQKIG
jgi:hypothetical protein